MCGATLKEGAMLVKAIPCRALQFRFQPSIKHSLRKAEAWSTTPFSSPRLAWSRSLRGIVWMFLLAIWPLASYGHPLWGKHGESDQLAPVKEEQGWRWAVHSPALVITMYQLHLGSSHQGGTVMAHELKKGQEMGLKVLRPWASLSISSSTCLGHICQSQRNGLWPCMSSGCWRQLLGPVGMDIFLVGAVKVGWRGLVAEVCVWGLGWNWETGQALLIVVVGALIRALHYNVVCGTCSWLVLKLFPGFEGFSTPNPGTRSSMYHQATGWSSQELLK